MPPFPGIKKVVRHINRGGMGTVDEIELNDGARVARKTFEPDRQAYNTAQELEKLRKRFEREVKYQAELGRIGAMPILYHDLKASPPWFIMPLAEKSYADQIAEDRVANKISPEPLADILSGLEQMHELGYVHRDLKPENVLYWDGTWRLSDFGLAASVVSTGTSRFTTLSSWGTQDYMAPEQMRDFKNVTAAADVYAFGCIVHELVDGTQRVPYAEQTVQGAYGFIVRKCTQTDPSKRFKSIAGLRSALMEELRRDPGLVVSAATEQWEKELADISAWDSKKLDEFVAHLGEASPGNEIHIIASLQQEHLATLAVRFLSDWESIATAYCDWARSSFTFEFCDVVAGCLRQIYTDERSNLAVKANAATALAELGARNRRWYCMRLLNPMTDNKIPDQLAHRIAMEIRANDLHSVFEFCAKDVYGWGRTDYHRHIIVALDEAQS